MMNKSCFCQNPDKKEIIVIKPQNFVTEIQAYFEAFRDKIKYCQKKESGGIRPNKECIKRTVIVMLL